MEQWPSLCQATSNDDPTCSSSAFISPLSFLSIYGIDDLSAASEEEIQGAWHQFV